MAKVRHVLATFYGLDMPDVWLNVCMNSNIIDVWKTLTHRTIIMVLLIQFD